MTRRVVISGMGALTSLGANVEQTWQGVIEGRSGIREIARFDSSAFPVHIGSEVSLPRVGVEAQCLDPSVPTRASQYGLWALDEAWRDAGLHDYETDPWRAGVCVGASSFPEMEEHTLDPDTFFAGDRINPGHFFELRRANREILGDRDMAAVSALMSARYGLRGMSMTVQSACSSGTQAIGEAMGLIRDGDADVMVTGGTDSLMSALTLTGFTLLGALSKWTGDPAQASRPFDLKRSGFVIGEGAAILVIEELQHALSRGVEPYAELIGYGSSLDGAGLTAGHLEGLGARHSMLAALRDADLQPSDVAYINAHGTSTEMNDRIETQAIKQVFGAHAYRLAVSSTKSHLGHLICAAGGIELIMTVLGLCRSHFPATLNLDHPDPDCDLDYIPKEPRLLDARIGLSNSFGFGGQNGTVIARRWGDAGDTRARS